MAETKKKQALPDEITDKAGAEAALAGLRYEKSRDVLAAEQKLADHEASRPGEYVSGYQADIDAALDRILNRQGFAYDLAADPAWHAYRDSYQKQGRLAMQDTMANAAALTGGYGSSYGAAAGSLAYQGWLDQLGAKVPALYQAALARYDSEGTAMADTLDALTRLDAESRKAHQDTVDAWQQQREHYAELAQAAYKQDYAQFTQLAKQLTDLRDYYADQDQQAYQRRQDELDRALAVQKFNESVRQWQAEQAADQAKWQAQLAHKQAELAYKKAKDTAEKAAGAASAAAKAAGQKASSYTASNAASVWKKTVGLQSILDAAYQRTR